MTIVNNTPAVDSALLHSYQLRLPAFEGPFDVLLRLVERSQLAITDISLVTVTTQFLNYVSSLESQEPVLLANFSSVSFIRFCCSVVGDLTAFRAVFRISLTPFPAV